MAYSKESTSSSSSLLNNPSTSHTKLYLGYLSHDFNDHPTAHLAQVTEKTTEVPTEKALLNV
eukprot:1995693-Ditylum_brightwellii.AAC.1